MAWFEREPSEMCSETLKHVLNECSTSARVLKRKAPVELEEVIVPKPGSLQMLWMRKQIPLPRIRTDTVNISAQLKLPNEAQVFHIAALLMLSEAPKDPGCRLFQQSLDPVSIRFCSKDLICSRNCFLCKHLHLPHL